jgi:hypothetical protein
MASGILTGLEKYFEVVDVSLFWEVAKCATSQNREIDEKQSEVWLDTLAEDSGFT